MEGVNRISGVALTFPFLTFDRKVRHGARTGPRAPLRRSATPSVRSILFTSRERRRENLEISGGATTVNVNELKAAAIPVFTPNDRV